MKTTTDRFWMLLKPDKSEIKNIYIYSLFYGLVNLSLPLGIQAIVNLIQAGQISTSWIMLMIFVVTGVFVIGMLQIYQLRITENLQQRIFTRAAFEFSYRIPKIKISELTKHNLPELANRFFDTITLQKGIAKVLIDFSATSIQIIFGLILLSLYHPFFIAFSLVLLVLLYLNFKFSGKKGLLTSLEESKFKYKVAHWLQEVGRTSISFKLAGNSDLHLKKTDKHVEGYLKAREKHFKALLHQYSFLIFFKIVITSSLLIVGGILVMDQSMNIGQFVAAEIIIIMLMNAVEKLILNIETIYDVLTSLEKIGEVTDIEIETSSGINFLDVNKNKGVEISINSLSYCYPDNQTYTLKNINLEIESNEKILITGANGSGKSTLLYLISALREADEGLLSFNKIPLKNIEIESLRSITGNCLMQDELFEGSLIENISLGRANISYSDISWAIQMVNLEGFIKQLPNGYETILNPLGVKISASIQYKIILARSIVHRPRLLLIEDIFGKLPVKDRLPILEFLTSKSSPWTLIVVSSETEYQKLFDKTVVISNGLIKANN